MQAEARQVCCIDWAKSFCFFVYTFIFYIQSRDQFLCFAFCFYLTIYYFVLLTLSHIFIFFTFWSVHKLCTALLSFNCFVFYCSSYTLHPIGDKTSHVCKNFFKNKTMLSELALPRFEEIVEKCRCDLRQQMSRSNNGLVSLFSFVCVVIFVLCRVCFSFYLFICIGLPTMGSGCLI